jgi:hypothetical protein
MMGSDAAIVWRSVSQSDANYPVMTGSRDAESDELLAKRAKVQRQLDFFFNKPFVRERRYLLSIVTNISYFIVLYVPSM